MNTLLVIGWNSLPLSRFQLFTLDSLPLAASNKGLQAVVLGLGLVLSVMLAALVCGIYCFARYRQGMSIDDPHAIFRDLCHAHDLTGVERRLMKRLAAGLELSCPSALFVDSTLWRLPDGSDRYQRLSKAEWDKLLKLQRTLFLPPPAKMVT